QDVLRRNRRIGLELEHPMPVGALLLDQRLYRTAYAGLEIVWRNVHCLVVMRALSAAARSPERNAPSMVAGSPVSVQSPASKRLAHRVEGEGRRAFCAGVAAKVARFSLTIRQGGGTSGRRWAAATSCQSKCARVSESISSSRSAALTVTDSRSGKAKTHSAVPPIRPTSSGSP